MRPSGLELADIFRQLGPSYRSSHAAALSLGQRRVMSAIERCRTAALGGHVEQCDACSHQPIALLRAVPHGVPRLLMHHRAPHQRSAAETFGYAERSTHPMHDAFTTRAAALFGQAGNVLLIAIAAPRRATPSIQSP